jgi:putative membrane protein
VNAGLAFANALLSAATAVCLVFGRRAILARRIEAHRNLMIGAFVASAAFLALFVARFVLFGFRAFPGTGAWRGLYYTVMFAHEPIAVLSVPLAIVTLVLGLRRSKVHIELARPTLVVWLVSTVTGVLMFVLLYVLPAILVVA